MYIKSTINYVNFISFRFPLPVIHSRLKAACSSFEMAKLAALAQTDGLDQTQRKYSEESIKLKRVFNVKIVKRPSNRTSK